MQVELKASGKALAFGIALGFIVAFAPSCGGSTQKGACSHATCTGCCGVRVAGVGAVVAPLAVLRRVGVGSGRLARQARGNPDGGEGDESESG